MSGTFTDGTGRTYPTTLSKSEYEAERAKADEVHVVRYEASTGGDL